MIALAMAGAVLTVGLAGTDSAPPRRDPSVERIRPTPAGPPSPDPWFGPDKLKHFVLAGFATSTAFAAARQAGFERRPAVVGAVVIAGGVSIAKEVADRGRGGRASVRDLVWDAVGIVAYGAILARTTR